MKKLIAKTVAVTFFTSSVSAVPHAEAAGGIGFNSVSASEVMQTMQKYVATPLTLKAITPQLRDEALRQMNESKTEVVAHVGQTMIMIYALSGIDAMLKELGDKDLSVLQKLNPATTLGLANRATARILNSGDYWLGSLGSAASLGAVKTATQAIQAVIRNPSLKAALAKPLGPVLSNTIGLVGWQFGTQLWNQSVSLLENVQDIERAKSLKKTGSGVLDLLETLGSPKVLAKLDREHQENARVAGLVLQNMLAIVIQNPHLRDCWFYNTWRLHIATGSFATLLGSTLAGSFAGTLLFPGGGTLVGMIFGIMGGAAAMLIPDEVKNQITYCIEACRRDSVDLQIENNDADLLHDAQPDSPFHYPSEAEQIGGLRHHLEVRRLIRAARVTVDMERIKYAIDEYRNPQADRDHRRAALEAIVPTAQRMVIFYKNDIARLKGDAENADEVNAPKRFQDLYASEITRVELLQQGLRAFVAVAAGGSQSTPSEASLHDIENFVETVRLLGFDEDLFYKKLN